MRRIELSAWVVIFLLGGGAYADTLDISTELGRRSLSDILSEPYEATEDDYKFIRESMAMKGKVMKDLNYLLSASFYDKDYDTQDENSSLTQYYRANLESDVFRLNFSERHKGYRHNSDSDYYQTKGALTIRMKDLFGAKWEATAGASDYSFVHKDSQDINKYFGELEGRAAFEERLKLKGTFFVQDVERRAAGKDRIETKTQLEGNYKLSLPHLEQIALGLELGRDQTLELEEREDIYDFEYEEFYVKTKHPLNKNLSFAFKASRRSKDYSVFENDFEGGHLEYEFHYKHQYDGGQKLRLDPGFFFNSTNFSIRDELDYSRRGIYLWVWLARETDWDLDCQFEGARDRFPNRLQNNKTTYLARVAYDKFLMDGALKLHIQILMRLKDYKEGPDRKTRALQLGATWRY